MVKNSVFFSKTRNKVNIVIRTTSINVVTFGVLCVWSGGVLANVKV